MQTEDPKQRKPSKSCLWSSAKVFGHDWLALAGVRGGLGCSLAECPRRGSHDRKSYELQINLTAGHCAELKLRGRLGISSTISLTPRLLPAPFRISIG